MSERGFRFWLARLLAPIAFFAAATLLVLVVRESFANGSDQSATTAVITNEAGEAVRVTTVEVERAAGQSADGTSGATGESDARFYRVLEGDTLDSIAAKFGLTVVELQRLNPGVDAVAIQVRQRIRLRE